MQGGKTQVAGLGEDDCAFHGLWSADFANLDDIRCLAHGILKC